MASARSSSACWRVRHRAEPFDLLAPLVERARQFLDLVEHDFEQLVGGDADVAEIAAPVRVDAPEAAIVALRAQRAGGDRFANPQARNAPARRRLVQRQPGVARW